MTHGLTPVIGEDPMNKTLHRSWWSLLFFTQFVILWGAFVRASGSGDGCGQNWPSCHGRLIPESSYMQTWIEYIHRASSGLYGLFVLALVIWTYKWMGQKKESSLATSPITSQCRFYKLYKYLPGVVLLLTVFEAFIGAQLVLSGLVGSNESWSRALVMIVHLLNTFLLVFSIMGCIYFLGFEKYCLLPRPAISPHLYGFITFWIFIVASLGAIAALGDTLYPITDWGEGLQQDFDSSSHGFIKLRVLHPLCAILLVFFIHYMGFDHLSQSTLLNNFIKLSYFVLFLGILNLGFLAPIGLQLLHLLSVQVFWCLFVFIGFHCFLGTPHLPFKNSLRS